MHSKVIILVETLEMRCDLVLFNFIFIYTSIQRLSVILQMNISHELFNEEEEKKPRSNLIIKRARSCKQIRFKSEGNTRTQLKRL